jgi:hypothetical protein
MLLNKKDKDTIEMANSIWNIVTNALSLYPDLNDQSEFLVPAPSHQSPTISSPEQRDRMQGQNHAVNNPPCPKCGAKDWYWETADKWVNILHSDSQAIRSCCGSTL